MRSLTESSKSLDTWANRWVSFKKGYAYEKDPYRPQFDEERPVPMRYKNT
jgi:hypothetical protein